MSKEHIRILSLLEERPWAITEDMMRTILDIVQQPLHEASDLDAVAARIGRPLANTYSVEQRDAVAVVDVSGPIFRYANLFTHFSGAVSIQDLSTDLQATVENPLIKHIVLNVNSPGGQYDGTNELADRIRALNQIKPVTAYVGGTGASAAYWLSAAAGRIVAEESAFVGSIGVVAAIRDNKAAQERQGIKNYQFVSSQSPRKRPDLDSAEGRAQIQEQVDIAAELFISKVASFRGVSAETVIEKFGKGGELSAAQALKVGMIDAIGNFEGLVEELNSKEVTYVPQGTAAGAQPPAEPQPQQPPAAPAISAEAVIAEERSRCQQIIQSEEAVGRTVLAQHFAYKTNMTVAEAKAALAAAPQNATETKRDPLAAAMAQIPNPKVGPGQPPEDKQNDAETEARAVLQFVPKARRMQQAS